MNLVLLVGTNPLPVYITLEYFANRYKEEQNNTVYLTYSKNKSENSVFSTMDYAENIKKVFELRNKEKITNINFSWAELKDITNINQINNDLQDIYLSGKCLLSIAGGTKLMVLSAFSKHQIEKILYIESMSNDLIIFNKNNMTVDKIEHNISLRANDLFMLHGHSENIEMKLGINNNINKYFTDDLCNEFIESGLNFKPKNIISSLEIENWFIYKNVMCVILDFNNCKMSVKEIKVKTMQYLNVLKQLSGDNVKIFYNINNQEINRNLIQNLKVNSDFDKNLMTFNGKISSNILLRSFSQ